MSEPVQKNDALAAYPAGHHAAVLSSHTSRTAQNSAMHLLPHLKPGMRILDVGCGPGTITSSFVDFVGETGEVIGIDPSEEVIQSASQSNIKQNVTFEVGNGAKLDFPNDSFDVVHAHQVLQHSTQVPAILAEMRRVVKKPGGIISLREGEAVSALFYPTLPLLQKDWVELYPRIASSKGADPLIGRKLHVKLREAGYTNEQVQILSSNWVYGANSPEEAKWWGESWAQRMGSEDSGFHQTAIEKGLATKEQLERISEAWLDWSRSEDACYAMINFEAIVRL